jgi:hypothetical protein
MGFVVLVMVMLTDVDSNGILYGVAHLLPLEGDIIRRGTSDMVRTVPQPLSSHFHQLWASPWRGVHECLLNIPRLVLKAWRELTSPLGLSDQDAGIAGLEICPISVLTYVSGIHLVGALSGTAITQDYRDRAPISCKLLKAKSLVDTLNFGSVVWNSQASDDRFQQLLNSYLVGEVRMRASESSIHVAVSRAVEFLWTHSLNFAYPGGTSTATSSTTPAIADADTPANAAPPAAP